MVVCCQRRHGRKQMRRALDETVVQDTITTNDINFTVPDHQFNTETADGSKGPLRLALMNKLDKSPLPRNRGGEISVLPQNCYPARSTSVEEREDLAARQPFLSVPNHVPTPSSTGTSRSPSSPQFRYPDLETNEYIRGGSQDSFKRARKDSSKKLSILTTPPKVPEINVVGVPPNDVWEQRGGDAGRVITPRELTPESLSDSESPLWKEFQADSKGTAEVNVIRRRRSSSGFMPESDLPPPVYPPVVHEEDDEEGADEVEMVTFSPRPPPPPLKMTAQSPFAISVPSSSRGLQGILKPSTSLPPPSYRAVVSVDIPPSTSSAIAVPRRSGAVASTTTTVAVHRVPAVPPAMPFMNVNPTDHRRLINPADHHHLINQPRMMIRQKAVEFHEIPHQSSSSSSSLRRSNAPPPLNLPHTDVSSSSATIDPGGNNNNDRSPSPWHQRVKPTAV